MTTATLVAIYSGSASTTDDIRLTLEQEPVSAAALTGADLDAMLALVRSGVSAQTYIPKSCPITIEGDIIHIALDCWAWPVPLDLEYTIEASAGDLAAPLEVAIWREFDLVIDFQRDIQLPFVCRGLTWEWAALPCWDKASNEVDRPTVTATETSIHVDADILGVLRIKGQACGYLHSVGFDMGTGAKLNPSNGYTLQATWRDADDEEQSDDITLDLPGCLELFEYECEDGEAVSTKSDIDDDDPKVTLYYNDCTGQVMVVDDGGDDA